MSHLFPLPLGLLDRASGPGRVQTTRSFAAAWPLNLCICIPAADIFSGWELLALYSETLNTPGHSKGHLLHDHRTMGSSRVNGKQGKDGGNLGGFLKLQTSPYLVILKTQPLPQSDLPPATPTEKQSLLSCIFWMILAQRRPMATHSSTLAWKIPWMEEPDRLQSMGSLRFRHD